MFSKPYANLVLPVKVVFVGEQAEDEGRPKREFFRLALAVATSDPALLSGPCDRRVVQHWKSHFNVYYTRRSLAHVLCAMDI